MHNEFVLHLLCGVVNGPDCAASTGGNKMNGLKQTDVA
jgi:hypothetical protein